MNPERIIAGLDIGSAKTTVVIAEAAEPVRDRGITQIGFLDDLADAGDRTRTGDRALACCAGSVRR